MNLILFGPPGSGKGTQARLLASQHNLAHICTGDILREEVKQQTPIGNQIKETMDSGNYPSDNIIMKVFRQKFESVQADGVVLDGVPRTMNQALQIDNLFKDLGRELDAVVQLKVDEKVLVDRLSSRLICQACGAPHTVGNENGDPKTCSNCGSDALTRRPDDEPEAVKTRLEVYNKETKPLLEYYSEQNKLAIVDGTKPVEEVSVQIQSVLKQMQILTSKPGCLYSAQDV